MPEKAIQILKLIAIAAVAAVVVAAIAIGSYRGRTTETTPAAVSAAAGALGGDEGQNEDRELDIVRTWSRKDCSLAPWLVTDKLGYFREEGIKLVFTGELQANQQVASILSGDNDVASIHPNALAVAVNGGGKLKGVSRGIIEPDESVDERFRHMWWFVNPDKHPGVKSFPELKKLPGRIKITTTTINTCTDFLTNMLADKYGVPRDKFEWVTMPDIQAIQALKQGLVDVSPVHPPYYKGMEDAGAVKISDSLATGLGAAAGLTVYYFREDYIEKNDDVVKRFVKAISKGQRYANENPGQVASWVSEAIGVTATGNHFYSTDTSIDESQIVPWIKQLEESKVIPEGKIKPSSLVLHIFEQYANQQ